MRTLYLISIGIVLGLGLAISGCNIDNEVGELDSDTHELLSTESATYGVGTKLGRDTIIINGMKFQPEHLSVYKGDTVVWINKGFVVHDVTVDSQGKSWSSDSIRPEKSWMKVIDEDFDYFCSIHPTMKGRVQILEK